VKALAESPWGVFTVGATIPIALFMGGYLRYGRVGKVLEASAIGIVLLLLAVWGGQFVHGHASWARAFTLREESLAWSIIIYGLAASVLPVWLLLAPRDYLSTFMKLGTIFALVLGVFLVLPTLKMPALSQFIDGSGPVVAGKLFPFCFITIACGAISGFHTLISSGTTPKLITRESYARPIGYGAMCLESLVAIMALIAACTLEPGQYLSINIKGSPAETIAKVNSYGFPVTLDEMNRLANTIGEKTLFGRTGGASTLAVGMAQIFSKAVNGRWLDLWYHFAIMFEALFILTTLDAGTRVGRYLLQDVLGNIWRPLGDTRLASANLLASLLMVSGWGYFLIQGVRDPLGGINSLWPLFGIANQLLASIALCLATTVILKMQLTSSFQAKVESPEAGVQISDFRFQISGSKTQGPETVVESPRSEGENRPVFAFVTLIPLVWLLSVTMTAGVQKVFHADPRIGFLAQARTLNEKLPGLEHALASAQAAGNGTVIESAQKAVRTNRVLHFNQILDAVVAGAFLVLVVLVVLLSVREWILLIAQRRLAVLHETKPVWLPDYALVEGKPLPLFGLFALAISLGKELSGEGEMERDAKANVCACAENNPVDAKASIGLLGQCRAVETPEQLYLKMTEKRFRGVNRCC
jgi:carbon starvation protein